MILPVSPNASIEQLTDFSLSGIPDLPPLELDLGEFAGELSLLRNPGAWKHRPLTEKAFNRLYDKTLFSIAFGLHSISGSSLLGMASQIKRAKGEHSLNVVLLSDPETDLYYEKRIDGTVTLYALRGGLVDARGTIYQGDFPCPIQIGILDDSRIKRSLSRQSFVASLPLLNDPQESKKFQEKSTQKQYLLKIAEESGIYIPQYIFIPPTSFIKSGINAQARKSLHNFLTEHCQNGSVIKPNSGSQGSGISILFDSNPPKVSVINQASSSNGILVEERMSSVPLKYSERVHDWNLRVLGTAQGVLDIEVRHSQLGKPVNISIDASAREFSPRFLSELSPKPENPSLLYKQILKALNDFCVKFCSHFQAGFIGVDIIISDITQCSPPSNAHLPIIQNRYLISCNEVNVGCVGGLSTLTRIRRSREGKLKALDKFIEQFRAQDSLLLPHQPTGSLVQAAKELSPSRVIHNALKSVSELSDNAFEETLSGLIWCINEEHISLDFDTIQIIVSEIKKRETYSLGFDLAHCLIANEDVSRLYHIFSLMLRHALGYSIEDIKREALIFSAKKPESMYGVCEIISFLSTLSPDLPFQFVKTVDDRILDPQSKMRSLRGISFSSKHWAHFFKSIDDDYFSMKIISNTAKQMKHLYEKLNSKPEAFEMMQHTLFYCAISEFLDAAVQLSFESKNLDAKQEVLEFANEFFTTTFFIKLSLSRQKKEIVMALFVLYLQLGKVEDAEKLKKSCPMTREDWEMDTKFSPAHLNAYCTPQTTRMLQRFKLSKESVTRAPTAEQKRFREEYFKKSASVKILNEFATRFS